MQTPDFQLRVVFMLAALFAALPLGCKDKNPCDPGQQSIGTGCFAIGGSGGGSAMPQAGDGGASDAGGAGGIAPPGNPDATWGTPCQSNAECGGPAPVCATDPLFYCIQINCDVGEENEGVCPEGWVCFPKDATHPSACVNSMSF